MSYVLLQKRRASCCWRSRQPQRVRSRGSGGAQRGMQPEAEERAVKNGHQYVVAIGIDHYENWPILSTAVSDATGFANC